MKRRSQRDAVVVGAGISGAAAALFLARRGFQVTLVDARLFAEAGARWVNAVPERFFDLAQVPRPAPPERRAAGGAFSLLAPSGARALTVDPSPACAVDMRRLGARLVRAGAEAGVEGLERARVVDVEVERGRLRAIRVERRGPRGASRTFSLEAALFVDASGCNAALRRRVPSQSRACSPPRRSDLCSAAQAVFEVADPEGAVSFLGRNQARAGEILSRTGVSGGYSIANICVSPKLDEVELLTGAIATPEHRSGSELIDGVRRANPWIGRPLFGGAGTIPLRRPYDRLGGPGLALLGDAACQVFPAHGSGIGVGLVAARILAESVADAVDPGGEGGGWRCQARFHREWGGLLAAYDVFRRLSQGLTAHELEAMLDAGLLAPFAVRAGLDQRLASPSPVEAARAARAALRAPRVAGKLVFALARMASIAALYRRYPSSPDERALARWSWAVARCFGEAPDVRG